MVKFSRKKVSRHCVIRDSVLTAQQKLMMPGALLWFNCEVQKHELDQLKNKSVTQDLEKTAITMDKKVLWLITFNLFDYNSQL